MEISLRPYQKDLLSGIYESWKTHDNVIAYLQTGGGKTLTFMEMIKQLQCWDFYVVIIMRRRPLIMQNIPILDNNGIDHGVYMADHRRYSPSKKVQLCSIDTLGARDSFPHVDKDNVVVIIDESHDCTPTGRKYAKIIEAYKGKKIVGFTATPFSDNSFFQDVVNPISALELMEQGYLVPAKIYAPDVIDVSSVSVDRMGNFNDEELFDVCSKSQIVGDIVKNWKKYGQNRRTILFAVNIEHSKMLCDAFNNAGIKAVHCDKDTKDSDRKRALESIRNDEAKILCNVNIFSTGLDLVEIECIIFARPTRSLIYYLQALGRGLRTALHIGKTDCIIIDSAGNGIRFGSPYKSRDVVLGKNTKPKGDIEDINVRICKQCFYQFKATEKICPECGFINPKITRKGYEEVDGELVEIHLSEKEMEQLALSDMIKKVRQCFFIQRKNPKLDEWFIGSQIEKSYGKEFVIKHMARINNVYEDLKRKYPDVK